MGAMTTMMVGLGAAQAATSVIGGMQAEREADRNAQAVMSEANYNASVLHQQAGMIEDAKNLKIAQHNRMMRFAMGKTTNVAAGKGLEMSGSPIAVAIDTMTQMEMDKAIDVYNLDIDKYAVLSEAESTVRSGQTEAGEYRRKGDYYRTSGIVGGLTTLMQTGMYASERSFDTSAGAKKGGKA